MASFYEHNYTAFGDEVLRAGFMRNIMRSRAVAMQATAEAIAPVDTGEYVTSFEVSDGIRESSGAQRAFGRLTNTSGHAAAVEYGYGRVPRYRILGRSAHSAGGEFRGSA